MESLASDEKDGWRGEGKGKYTEHPKSSINAASANVLK